MDSYSRVYQNPLSTRYASSRMLYIFSAQRKFRLWRELWIALAKAQRELGLSLVTKESIQEMELARDVFDAKAALEHEKRLKHDVMAQIEAYGEVAPKARGVLHLGATSAFVGDNADLVQMRDALLDLRYKLAKILENLRDFSHQYKDLPTLGYTHFQAAQLTTVGKRASLWMQSFVKDYQAIERCLDELEFLGVKGTTGTQASFAQLFDGDFDKVQELERLVAKELGFSRVQALSGQTYDRKTDHQVLSILSGIAQSAHKMTNDLRLLQHLKELEEPFATHQVGSSAMAYKRNPIYAERIASLCKLVISLSASPPFVSSTQWLERTLDDSANRRIVLPEAFLAVDAICRLLQTVVPGLKVYKGVIERHVQEELPFMATETLLMEAASRGMDRQDAHKILRDLSMEEVKQIKENGKKNELLSRITADGRLGFTQEDLEKILDPKRFVGFAPRQVETYIQNVVDPLLLTAKDHTLPDLGEDFSDTPPSV